MARARIVTEGYYRYPALYGDQLAFVCEDDIWSVALEGGIPRRLSCAPGPVSHPHFSPNGDWIAFTCLADGYEEVYVLEAEGGPCTRMTFLGADTATVLAWSPDSSLVLFLSSANQAMPGSNTIWMVPLRGGDASSLHSGPADSFCFQPGGVGRLLGRHTGDVATAQWKGYRGGCTGELWIDSNGCNEFVCMSGVKGNIGNPIWVHGNRLIYIAEQEGGDAAEVYACDVGTGENMCMLAKPPGNLYARHLAVDASSPSEGLVVFMAGGSLFCSKLQLGGLHSSSETRDVHEVAIRWRGPKSGCELRHVDAMEALESMALHPTGLSLAITARGQAFSLGLFNGPALSYLPYGVTPTYAPRCRMLQYLFDWPRMILVADGGGEEGLEIHTEDASCAPFRLNIDPLLLGRPCELVPSPQCALVGLVNDRSELLIVDTVTAVARVADFSLQQEGISGLAWSPCGHWLAYSYSTTPTAACLKVLEVESGETHRVTTPTFWDSSPAWDPDGRFLYFVSSREFEPVYDELQHNLSFPRGQRPYILTLRNDVPNPLLPELRAVGQETDDDEEEEYDEEDQDSSSGQSEDKDSQYSPGCDQEQTAPEPTEIDLDGIEERVVALPVSAGRYEQIVGLEHDALMYTVFPVPNHRVGFEPTAAGNSVHKGEDEDSEVRGDLVKFDLRRLKESVLISNAVQEIVVSMDGESTAILESDEDGAYYVRVVATGEKPKEEDDDDNEVDAYAYGRDSGLVDIESRVRVLVDPVKEWGQMLRATWRAARDSVLPVFLSNPAVGPRWEDVYNAHAAALPKLSSRTELQDVLTELCCSLRCSHAFVCAPVNPGRKLETLRPACIGADLVWDGDRRGYRIKSVVRGDVWCSTRGGPLAKPGVGLKAGDLLLAINRTRLTEDQPPGKLLLNAAGHEVMITVEVKEDLDKALAKLALKADSEEKLGGTERMRAKKGVSSANGGRKDKAEKPQKYCADQHTKQNNTRHLGKGQGKTLSTKDCSIGALNPLADKWVSEGSYWGPGVKNVRVRALSSDVDARYRDMVAGQRARVHQLSDGRVGYLHVPDMERLGFSEFHRHWGAERVRGGLIVDLRGNSGGHISELLLPRLAQRALGFEVTRTGPPVPFPEASVAGPVALLVDHSSCSDAEIAAHCFQQMKIGPVVGTRTWGGVAGVGLDASTVDGTTIGLPVMGIFMSDKGYDLENCGVAPSIEIPRSPQEYMKQLDSQLDAAVRELLGLLEVEASSVNAATVPLLPKLLRETQTAAAVACASNEHVWPFKAWQPIQPQIERSFDVPWATSLESTNEM